MGERSITRRRTAVAPRVDPIDDGDIPWVADFLEATMSSGVLAAQWRRSFGLNALAEHPNNGFMLVDGERVVGAYAAYYSVRDIEGRPEAFCNLGAWSVLPEFRLHGVRLLRAIVGQPGYHFLDLSPSGNVVRLNERLGFRHLDDRISIVPAVPWPYRPGSVSSDPAVLGATLTGRERALFDDHREAAAARHVVIRDGERWCYVVFRMDRRKRSPRVFASLLHVSDPVLFHRRLRALGSHLLVRHGAAALLVERRLVGAEPRGGFRMVSPRKKMMLSPTLRPDQIDYFYSELVSLRW